MRKVKYILKEIWLGFELANNWKNKFQLFAKL